MPEQPVQQEGWSATSVCRIAGISYRQLDYWIRTDLITPSISAGHGSGTRRVFSRDDIRLVKIIQMMLCAGLHLTVVRGAVALFQGQVPLEGWWLIVITKFNAHTHGADGVIEGQRVSVAIDLAILPTLISSGESCWIGRI